jgi:hypothetical protein
MVENVFRRGRHCYVVVYEPKKRRAHWAHPYIKINVNGRAFIAAKELSQDDRKFKLFYRISKESFAEVVRVFGPAITTKGTNCRQCIGVEERLLITLCKPKYLFTIVYLKLHIFVYLQKVLTFRILRIFRQLIIINAPIFFCLLYKFYVVQRIVFRHCNASVVTISLLLCDCATEVAKKPARPIARNCDREGRRN